MLPISEILQVVLFAAFVFSASILVVSMKKRYGLPILAVLIVAWAFLFVPDQTNPQYNFRNQVAAMAAIPIFGVGALWTWLVSFIPRRDLSNTKRRLVQASIAISPAVILISFFAFRQYVPSSTCSTDSLSLTIGDTKLRIPVEYSAYFRLADGNNAPAGERIFYNVTDPGSKEELGDVCQLEKSSGGTIRVDQLKITPGKYDSSGAWLSASHIDRVCADRDTASRPVCENHTPGIYENFHSISIARPGDPSQRERIDRFQSSTIKGAVKSGDLTAGSVCIGLTSTEQRLTCHSWRPFDRNRTVAGSSWVTPGANPSELVADVKRSMEQVISVIMVPPTAR
jgi:hypothetical protein